MATAHQRDTMPTDRAGHNSSRCVTRKSIAPTPPTVAVRLQMRRHTKKAASLRIPPCRPKIAQ